MIPNMYKIAGELTSTVFQIAARSLAAQGLSIFGDHSDVMAARSTGWAMLFANSVQEVMDLALVAQASTLATRVPFLHVFDGFRTSHEVMKIEQLGDEDIRAMIDDSLVQAHRARGLTPDAPVMRGTAQNPDVYFQARESSNPFYLNTPGIVQEQMDKFAAIAGRQYHLFDYVGAPDAERVIVIMGSGAEAAQELVDWLLAKGEKVGMVKVRLFRPFSIEHFVQALPSHGQKNRGAGPHQGTRRRGRAALSGCGDGHCRGAGHGRGAFRRHAAHRGRTLRPLVQRIHAGHGEGGLR